MNCKEPLRSWVIQSVKHAIGESSIGMSESELVAALDVFSSHLGYAGAGGAAWRALRRTRKHTLVMQGCRANGYDLVWSNRKAAIAALARITGLRTPEQRLAERAARGEP